MSDLSQLLQLIHIGYALGAGNIFWTLPVFEVPFKDSLSSLNFNWLVTICSFGFSIVGLPIGFIPVQTGATLHLAGILIGGLGMCLFFAGFEYDQTSLVYIGCFIMSVGMSVSYFMLLGATIHVDPDRHGRSLGIVYCFFGVSLIIGPQLAKLYLSLAQAGLAYIFMSLSFVIPAIPVLFYIYFPPNELKSVSIGDLFRSKQNIFMATVFFSFGFGPIMLSSFQQNYMEWFQRSEGFTFDVYTFLNFFTPIPRLLAGYAQDWFGAKRVLFYFTISVALNFFIFAWLGKSREVVYLWCFFFLIFCMHAYPPLLLGINQYVWRDQGRKMFSVMFPIYSFGVVFASFVANELDIRSASTLFGALCTLVPCAVMCLRQKQKLTINEISI